jgi:hypothetical protein
MPERDNTPFLAHSTQKTSSTIISVATTLFGYALEIIGKALSELVKEGNLKQRVLNAASQLVLAPETDLPDHLKKRLEALKNKVTANNGKIPETITQMDDEQIALIASEIVVLNRECWVYKAQHKAAAS